MTKMPESEVEIRDGMPALSADTFVSFLVDRRIELLLNDSYELGDVEREYVTSLCDRDLAWVFYLTLQMGDAQLASLIWDTRGPIDFTLESEQGVLTVVYKNQRSVFSPAHGQPLAYLRREDEALWLDLVDKASRGYNITEKPDFVPGPVNGWSTLLMDASSPKTISIHRDVKIPMIEGGRIKDSGYLRGLQLTYGERPYEWFGDVLCLAPAQMVLEHQDSLHPFESVAKCKLFAPEQGLGGSDVEVEPVVELVDFGRSLADGTISASHLNSVTLGIQVRGRSATPLDRHLIGQATQSSIKLGLGIPPGYVLCRSDLKFLERFEFDVDSNIHAALMAVRGASTIARMVAKRLGPRPSSQPRVEMQERLDPEHLVAKIARDDDTREELIGLLSEEGARKLFQQTSSSEGLSLRAMKCALGRLGMSKDNLTLRVGHVGFSDDELDPEMLKDIKVSLYNGRGDVIYKSQLLERVIKAGGGSVYVDGVPVDVSDSALYDMTHDVLAGFADDPSTRHSYDAKMRVVYTTLWASRGVDAFARHAADRDDWHYALAAFGVDSLVPYLRKLPRDLRVKLAGARLSL
ncbi:hypothetical protein ACYPKM_01215 [Pseudomonas aeruginosa]